MKIFLDEVRACSIEHKFLCGLGLGLGLAIVCLAFGKLIGRVFVWICKGFKTTEKVDLLGKGILKNKQELTEKNNTKPIVKANLKGGDGLISIGQLWSKLNEKTDSIPMQFHTKKDVHHRF